MTNHTPIGDAPVGQRAYTTRQVAEILGGLSDKQVRGLIKSGKLRARNTGRAYIIPVSALDEYLGGSDEPMRHPWSA